MRILSAFGSVVVAGNTIGIRLIIFALLPAWGLANAAATMVGQALGAGKPERAEQAAWLAARYNVVCLGAVSVLFIAAALADRRHLHQRPRGRAPRRGLPAHR